MHMKNIFKSILALTAVAFVVVSCDVTNVGNKISPNDVAEPAASFVQKVINDTELAAATTSYDIQIGRSNANQPAMVAVQSTFPESVCPSVVGFGTGQYETTLSLNISELAVGTTLKGTIALVDQAGHANTSLSVTLAKAYKWNPYGTVKITDDLVTAVFTVQSVTWQVEAEKAEGVDVYRLLDPYGPNYPYNDPGDYKLGAKWVIDASDPNGVVFERTNLGFNWGYGEFNVFMADGVKGTMANKVITFPKNGLKFDLPDYGTFTANADAKQKIDLNL